MNRNSTIAAAAAFAAVAAATFSAPSQALDFSCRDATLPAEQAICSDRRLSRLDETMAQTYGRLWSLSGTRARLDLRATQHRFLAARNDCRWDQGCIRGAYLDRLSVLEARLGDLLDK